ncbi:hypothetical protein [Erwinia sp. Leaf53]|uniref:hypothetical protein n=1 Tax=Erwinia sp. Leaf53 TaxID=1736225 RepID=UPI0006FA04FD|nr:hypothetical protein [Erwinia sp. Leaf53]KQN58024.1 hypothetical protein ASF13_04315 [Erwinia sp. Leaf53]
MRYPLMLSTLLLVTTGCSQFPHHAFFVPPEAGDNTAWVRIVGGTESASIQQQVNGKTQGGMVRSSEWILTHTRDGGMPVDSRQNKSAWGDYYETPVIAGRSTHIGQVYDDGKNSCVSGITFTPKKGHYYQFSLQVDLRLYQCRGLAYELKKDAQGNWRLEDLQGVTWGGKYDATENGDWRRMSYREKPGI